MKASDTGAGSSVPTLPDDDRSGETWHLDEVSIRIRGVLHYLWRAVDQQASCWIFRCRTVATGRSQALLQRPSSVATETVS